MKNRKREGNSSGVPVSKLFSMVRCLLLLLVLILIVSCSGGSRTGEESAQNLPPNIVIILTDDQGYQDVGVFGSPDIETPNLDRLASEGMRFTRFYVAQPVCSASRAALLTGCYSNRFGINGALGPGSTTVLAHDEVTIAEMLRPLGYATACFGKWHLGDFPEYLPTGQGFDEYVGIPYSNDMWPYHPTNPNGYPPLPLLEGTERIDTLEDQSQLTTMLTERAVDFIDRHHSQPFFLYVPHPMPHVPLFVSEKFRGKSPRGLYGDVIMEVDWSVGQIMEALERHGLTGNTLVLFTSDNGPWLSYGDHAGSAAPLREGKHTVWEGGVRVPAIMRWPGHIPAGRFTDVPLMTIDLLPTIAGICGAPLPDRKIDGLDVLPILTGEEGAVNPHEGYYFYYGSNELQAVMSGPWKLYLPHTYFTPGNPPGIGGMPGQYRQVEMEVELYNVVEDIAETSNLADQYPEVVEQLLALATKARDELGDALVGGAGRGVRPAGSVENQ